MEKVLRKLLEAIYILDAEQLKLLEEEEFEKEVKLENGIVVTIKSDGVRAEKISYGYYRVLEPLAESVAMLIGIEISDEFNDIIVNNEINIDEKIRKLKSLT